MIISIVLLILVGGLAFYFFKQYSDLRNNPNMVSQETTKRLVGKVGKLYALPQDEDPTVAEVKDKDKLKEQSFFANAQNGDYILIYPKAKVAILYREKENKLINVGPIAIDSNQQQGQAAKVTVKIVNGTNTAGRASAVGNDLNGKLPNLVSVDQSFGDAKRKNYTKSLVVDVNKNKPDQAKQIADAIGGEVGDLPAGEDNPGTDILIIAGQ
jgi:hypothetical protein